MDENNNQFEEQNVNSEVVDDGKGMSIAALVLGILGIVGGWLAYVPLLNFVAYFTLVFSILAIIFGAKARQKSAAAGVPTGLATAGFVLGIIGAALDLLGIICVGCVAGTACALAGLGAM